MAVPGNKNPLFLIVMALGWLVFACSSPTGPSLPSGDGITVEYFGNGAAGRPPVDGRRHPAGDEVTVLDLGGLMKTGFALGGWNTRQDGLGTSYAVGARFEAGSSDIKLYAIWIPGILKFESAGTTITLTGMTQNIALSIPLVIPPGVTAIGEKAFEGQGFTEVTIPLSVTSIGSFAFVNNDLLHSLRIPASVAAIGPGAFSWCNQLTAIEVDERNSEFSSVGGVLYNKLQTKVLGFPAGFGATYSVPSGVTGMGEAAFQGCTELVRVDLPAGLTTIGNQAFVGCVGLSSADLPAGLLSLGDGAFASCVALPSVALPDGLVNLGVGAFDLTGLTTLAIPASVRTIGGSEQGEVGGIACLCIHLAGITVAGANPNFKAIDGVLFNKAGTILIQSPGGVSGDYTVPDGVIRIDSNAFAGGRLIRVNLASSVTVLGEQAFSDSRLTEITLPEHLQAMGKSVFDGCPDLMSVTILALDPPFLPAQSRTFALTPSGLRIRVPGNRLQAYQTTPGWSDYASLFVTS